MHRSVAGFVVVVAMWLAAWSIVGSRGQGRAAAGVRATRLEQNPLITTRMAASLGDNINGPSVIRVPPWVDKPLGRYYMYFAHHMGAFIRMAYANAIAGPWTIYEPGVLPVQDTAFFRPQPDPVENLEDFYTHVASPEVHVDAAHRRLVVWFHGWWTDGTRWPVGIAAAREWARRYGYGQFTQAADSTDGLHFDLHPAVTKASYLRVFQWRGDYYALARLGLVLKSKDPLTTFEPGPGVFRNGPYANRVRHVAVLPRGSMLYVFFTAIGDAPERILMSTVDLAGDWRDWKASAPVDVLQPEASYECPNLPNLPSEAGDVKGPVRELRDPAVFEEDGRTFLFYSVCGEQGIAAAELSLP